MNSLHDLLSYWVRDFAVWYSQMYIYSESDQTALRDLVFWVSQIILVSTGAG